MSQSWPWTTSGRQSPSCAANCAIWWFAEAMRATMSWSGIHGRSVRARSTRTPSTTSSSLASGWCNVRTTTSWSARASARASPSTCAAMPPTTSGGYSQDNIATRTGPNVAGRVPPTLRNMSGMLFGDIDLHLLGEGNHRRLWDLLGAHVTAGGARFAVWAPNARRVSVIGDWNDWTPGQDDLVPQGRSGYWAGEVAGVRGRAALQVRRRGRRRHHAAEGRPGRPPGRAPARQCQHRRGAVLLPVGRRGVDHRARRPLVEPAPAAGLRGAPRVVAARPRLRRCRRTAGGSRRAPRVHARRVAARRRAPLRRLVGLPGHRLLRADGALRNARTTSVTSSTCCTSGASA